jgi:ABC-type nickel/cobalt efflux system permease component RcnA
VVQGLSYCNHCGAKTAEKRDHLTRSSEVRPEPLVAGMVAALVFGIGAIVLLLMAMKMVGLNQAQILAFTILSFLLMLLVESVLIWQLFSRKRGAETGDTALAKRQTTNELDMAQARLLPEAMPSVTEHTTRAFNPIYSEREPK